MIKDETKKLLSEFGCPKSIVVRGVQGVICDWESFTSDLNNGTRFSLDFYVNRLQARLLICQLDLPNKSWGDDTKRGEILERLRVADSDFQSATKPCSSKSCEDIPEEINWIFKRVPVFDGIRTDPLWINSLEELRLPGPITKKENAP